MSDSVVSDLPLVSIVMPAWNPRQDWLRAAVGSALGQSNCDLELIVVDDGSHERVRDLLADVDDPRLRVIRVDHGGAAHARNAGICAAQGEFLRFVDADDVLEPGSTARLLGLVGDDATIGYGATLVCDDRLVPLSVKRSRLEGWIAEACVLYRFDVMHESMLFPRPVVDAVGEWDGGLGQCEDWDYVLRALEHAPVRGEQRIASYYRRHEASRSANLKAVLQDEPRVVERYFERHPEQIGGAVEREARARLLMVRLNVRGALGMRRHEQARVIAQAFALHPRRAAEELGREGVRLGTRLARKHGWTSLRRR